MRLKKAGFAGLLLLGALLAGCQTAGGPRSLTE
jgi:predicted small secreted protein